MDLLCFFLTCVCYAFVGKITSILLENRRILDILSKEYYIIS